LPREEEEEGNFLFLMVIALNWSWNRIPELGLLFLFCRKINR
jgi:hypothetical protein